VEKGSMDNLDIFRKIFQNKQFKIVKADHESVQLKYTPSKFLELARIEEENSITEANKKLFVNYVEVDSFNYSHLVSFK
jgi:hypothetical protein